MWNGVYSKREDTWLRWCDRNGKLIASGVESNVLKEQRAEQESQRAGRAEQSVARLKEKLREMGIDPEEI